MLKAVINGQSSLKQELLKEIGKVRSDVLEHKRETKYGFNELTKRVDKIGKQVAYLEDDAPTREEHDELEKRVGKVEQRVASV